MTGEKDIICSPALFERVVEILERGRSNVIKAVNTNMVMVYWLIGREIVQELQNGDERAEYGSKLLESLSSQLTAHYGSGFSITNLRSFRKFYQMYQSLITIQHPPSTEFELNNESFSPQLSWSHYRALMRVKKLEARIFYEQETIKCGWDKRTLERHIQSQYYERLLKSQNPAQMQKAARNEKNMQTITESLKNPYVLEFLGLPQLSVLHESDLETAIITHLQKFLLELGRGFAFVARQKRMRYEDDDFFLDLVFYNCILKCYLLIELKVGKLTARDVGQMDSYVRMFDDAYTAADDNPTIGLILCTEKSEAVGGCCITQFCCNLLRKPSSALSS